MYCPSCGKEIKLNDIFCSECGHKIESSEGDTFYKTSNKNRQKIQSTNIFLNKTGTIFETCIVIIGKIIIHIIIPFIILTTIVMALYNTYSYIENEAGTVIQKIELLSQSNILLSVGIGTAILIVSFIILWSTEIYLCGMSHKINNMSKRIEQLQSEINKRG